MILLDYFPFPQWISINSMAARVIQAATGATIHSFGFVKPFKKTKDLYRAFGIKNHLQVAIKLGNLIELSKIYKDVVISIRSAEDVFDIQIDGVKIGIPIYESILRSGKITVDLDDIETFKYIYRGILQYIFFRELFSSNKIEAILVSHDCYIGPGLLDHMAHRFEVPSIYANPFEINIPFKANQLYDRFNRYPEYFASLPLEKRNSGRAKAEIDLNSRLSGKIGIKMGYQEESAFEKNLLPAQLVQSNKLKVLIATHDFYDNPHSYGEMLFNDFSIWLDFLKDIERETTYDWYLKCHKDASLQEINEIVKFSQKNPSFRVINPLVSFHQLKNEGLDFVLTCYGSVGHELPLLGINVLNSSHNPHIAYSFNFHAKSISDYREQLLHLAELSKVQIPTNEIYEFFYVHNYVMWPDNYIFPSYEAFLKETDSALQSNAALKYIGNNYEYIERNVGERLRESIQSRRVFSVERMLVDSRQIKYPISAKNKDFFRAFQNKHE